MRRIDPRTPVRAIIATLHSDILRDLTAIAAVAAIVAATMVYSSWWVG